MRGWFFILILAFKTSAWADALIINETPQPFEYEPSTSLELVRELSPSPPQLVDSTSLAPEKPVPFRDNAFLIHAPSGELAIDVPELQKADTELQQRKSKKFEARKFMAPNLTDVQDQARMGVRILKHTIQQSIDEKGEEPTKSAAGFRTGSTAISANLWRFETLGLKNQFQVQLRAADSTAALNYRGLADASLSYQTEQRTAGVELKRRSWLGIDLIYGYITSPIENKQLVKLSWNF